MRSRTWLNLVLLSLALAAGGWYAWKKQLPRETPGMPLTALSASAVERIRVDRPGASFSLHKRDGVWRLSSPLSARVDDFAAGRLASLAELRASAVLSADDLSRYDLDKPWARVTLNDQVLALGGTNPLSRELYIETGGKVYLVPLQAIGFVPKEMSRLLSLRLLGEREVPVAIATGKARVTLAEGRWQRAPASDQVSADDIGRWVDAWRMASGTLTQQRRDAPALARYLVTLQDGGEIAIDVLTREPEVVMARADEGLEYHLPRSTGAVLLAFPGGADPN